jgi:osmoprotectant transport system permease protein
MNGVWTAFIENEGWLRLRRHILLSLVPLAMALVIGVALGILSSRLGRAGRFVIGASAFIARMVPTFAVMALVMALRGVGFWPAVVGLVLLGVPTILLNTATGLDEADRHTIDAARGMGYTEGQLLRKIRLPLALPHIAAGLRTAAVLTIATAALAGLIGADGLGVTIDAGFATNQRDVLLAGAIPVTLLALAADLSLLGLQYVLTPVALRRRSSLTQQRSSS